MLEEIDMDKLDGLPKVLANKACHECIRLPTCIIIQNQFQMMKASTEGVEEPPLENEEDIRAGIMHVIAPNCKLFIPYSELKEPDKASR